MLPRAPCCCGPRYDPVFVRTHFSVACFISSFKMCDQIGVLWEQCHVQMDRGYKKYENLLIHSIALKGWRKSK